MSDDRTEEIKKNILSADQWIRILYMVFYAVACWMLLFVLPIIILIQVIITLISGRDNTNLRELGALLADYLHNAMNYLLYVTDEKPWPFGNGENFGSTFSSAGNREPEQADVPEPTTQAPVTEPDVSPAASSTGVSSDRKDESTADDVFSDITFTGDVPSDESDDTDTDTPEKPA